MLSFEIATWIVLGLVLGAVTHYLSSQKPSWFETLLMGAVGAFAGGYLFRTGGASTYSAVAVVTAGVGAVVFLVIDGLFHGRRPPEHRPQT